MECRGSVHLRSSQGDPGRLTVKLTHVLEAAAGALLAIIAREKLAKLQII